MTPSNKKKKYHKSSKSRGRHVTKSRIAKMQKKTKVVVRGRENASFSCDDDANSSERSSDVQGLDGSTEQSYTSSNSDYHPSSDSCNDLNNLQHNNTMGNDSSILTGDLADHHEPLDQEEPIQSQPVFPSKRRIVDMDHYFQALQETYMLHKISGDRRRRVGCNFNHLVMKRALTNGLKTKVKIGCTRCDFVKWVDLAPDAADAMTLNESIVSASMFAGTNYNNVQELFAGIDVPFLTPNAFKSLRQEKLLPYFEWAALKEMEEAGREESELAIAAGQVINGIAYIVVICDGSWMNRSYRSSKHDSLSGMACIIGQRTGKVLYAGVHNKYCSMCAWYERKNMTVPEHQCFKTWGRDVSSGSMEQHIIVTGFKCSIQMHNLIYKTLVADGDSSVYQMILDGNPYPGIKVEKIECSNHLLRNFCTKIVEMSKSRNLNLPRGSIGPFRSMLKKSAFRFRKFIKQAVLRRSGQANISESEKAKLLQKDIMNMIDHVYGDHSNCARPGIECDPAKAAKQKNEVANLKKSGLYNAVKKAADDLSCHSLSLIRNCTSNSVESFNNCIAKAIGGKRTNHGCRDSYYMRSLAGLMMFNSKQAIFRLNEFNNLTPCNEISIIEKQRKAKVAKTKEAYQRVGRNKRFFDSKNPDYGENCKKPDVDGERFEELCLALKERLQMEAEDRINIERSTVGQSENSQWYEYKKDRLTASLFGKVCRRRETTRTAKTVGEILYPKASTSKLPAVEYGIMHEPEALRELSNRIDEVILPCGLFIDETLYFLGASPDGLIGDDTVVEIKCPYSCEGMSLEDVWKHKKGTRRIFNQKDINKMNRNHPYYYQVQGQLHITGRQTCIFAIWTRKEMHHVYVKKDDQFRRRKMEPKLSKFWIDCVMPEIVDSRHTRMMDLREPYIVQTDPEPRPEPSRRSHRVKRKYINDLTHLIGETEPPRQRQRTTPPPVGTDSDGESSPMSSPNVTSRGSQCGDRDPTEEQDSIDYREQRNCHSNDRGSSDGSVWDDSDGEDSASEQDSNLSDYPDSDLSYSFSEDEDDSESEDDQQPNHRQQSDHGQFDSHPNNHQRNNNQQNEGTRNNNGNAREILDTASYEQPLNEDDQDEANLILGMLNIDQVEDTERVMHSVLLEGAFLEDDAINLFLNILIQHIETTRNVVFTHPVHYFVYPTLLRSIGGLDLERDHLQIIGDSQSMHWCCIYYSASEKHVYVYDSLRFEKKFSRREELYFRVRYPGIQNISFPKVTRQPIGSNACGIYAAAFAATKFFHGNPAQINFSQNEMAMRRHFVSVVRSGTLTPFPTQ